MGCVLFMTSLYYDPDCSPHTPLVMAVAATPRFMGKERELTLECQSWGQKSKEGGAHIFGKWKFSSSVRVLHLLLMGGPTWSIVISNDGNWRNFLRAGVWPVTIVFFYLLS